MNLSKQEFIDYCKFRDKFDELDLIVQDGKKGDFIIASVIHYGRKEKKSRLQIALLLIETLACELNKRDPQTPK